ncbi:SDR family NAD(P)-dependent oxidoreductase [Paenibacillus barcinonensis]|uniref:3-oxoacyl-[acyl-carrier protein] reductase n=1 Tax=Paenibacillus barcinonensis TaxID=198119 RepID=A0A2V4V9F7_PAEBA|nr:SDR family NAD(P)-dependent oxidoreductase [Paenibacillus barcinonensis]PYE49535.1 3-oxoacyl-[acyl-carrier protein] reductase [Paenibacillus barcinonensis]QKS56738.1 SDR family NAD(P)-dependent oxidoreductase [Paenibacillus barcinonensis]
MTYWADRIVLITGGGTGIGRAVSTMLAERGARVVLNYSRSKQAAEETVQHILNQGGRAFSIQANVASDTEVRQMVREITEMVGPVTDLVNSAGMTYHIPLDDLEMVTDEIWNELHDVNVKGMFHCVRAVTEGMKQAGGGAIVNLGSIAGSTGKGSSLPYAVSKAAVHGLTLSLAHALSPHIRVNAIIPGAVATRWWAGHEERMHQLGGQLLLKRIASPEDIAHMICAALEQPAMTGQLITVDGGQTL